MKQLRIITRNDEAEKIANAVKAGQLRLMQEVTPGDGMRLIVLSNSGAAQAIVGKGVDAIVRASFDPIANEDGLFPGFSQTHR